MNHSARGRAGNGEGSELVRVRTRAELESLILQTAHEAFVSMDANAVIIEWNPEAERTFGWSRSEAVGRELAETIIPQRLRAAHREGLRRFLATGEERVSNRRIEVVALRRDGHEFPVELTIAPVAVDGGYEFNAFLHDISDRKQLERYRTVHNAVNEVLLGPAPLAKTMPALLELLGEGLDWQLGAYWRVDEAAGVIRCEHFWSGPALPADGFVAQSAGAAFGRGTGLPGRVWQSGEAVWLADVRDDSNFPRFESAARAGLVAATCFPLWSDGNVVGVIEFFCKDLRHPDASLLELYGQVSNQVASFLERKRVKESLAQEGRFLRAVLDNVDDGIVACDADGVLTVFNRATRELHGIPGEALPAEEWAQHYDLYHADGTTPMATEDVPLVRALRGELVRDSELVIAPKNGKKRLLVATGQPLFDGEGVQRGAMVAMHDITDRKQAENELAHQAMHDPLTGLPNRSLLLDRIHHALELSRRLESMVVVFFLDLDNFKLVNDSFGHHVGDHLLRGVASRLGSLLRASDSTARLEGTTVARLGGDEFVVLCEGLRTERDAIQLAERLSDGLALPFALDGKQLNVTASIGIAIADGPNADADCMIRDADVAMYRAKGAGRNRYEVFNEEMRLRVLERLQVEGDLRAAIERDELRVHYQPIVAIGDGGVVGLEALVRWEHPTRGVVSPAEFIPLAEETGLIVPIGAQVLRQACSQVARWDKSHPDRRAMYMSVNVSAHQLTTDFLDTVLRTLQETGVDPGRLVLEITESVVVENRKSAQLVQALADHGIRLALDDFGTGYSSLSYLTRFPLDILKIDRSLISMLELNPQARRVTAAAIEMGQALGMKVVGEGVETTAQLDLLANLGCDFAQGYLFARPQPADSLDSLLTRCRVPLGTA